jgi:16S rRNA (cytosine967-C5)-methyltransferase
LVERWLAGVGLDNAEQWLRFNNRPAPLTLRVNTLRATVEEARRTLQLDGIETELTRYAPAGLVVRSGQLLARPDDGLTFIQDEASQLIPLAVGAAPGERVLDLCAAPGGKTTAMAADMRDRGLLVAADVRVRRVALLRETVRRSGATTIRIVRVAPDRDLPLAATFDRVLVDAPCSGLGTLRRDPDVKWRRQPSDLPALAVNQLRLLERAAAVVRPSGRLVYATCSSEPEENERVVAAFLERHAAFEQIDLGADPSISEDVRPLVDPGGAIRTWPHVHGLEAFYAAALQRRH